MISNGVISGGNVNDKRKFYSFFKVFHYFAFPIFAFLAMVFALGLFFKSQEGYNSRLISGILCAACAAIAAALAIANSRLEKKLEYNAIKFAFMKNASPFSIIMLIVLLLITLFPFYVILINSVKTSPEANGLIFTFFPQEGIIFDHYAHLFTNSSRVKVSLVTSFLYSLFYSIVPVFIGTFVSAFAAYGFAKLNYPGRAFVYNFMIFTLMVPACVSMASSYVMYDTFGWTRTTSISLVMVVPGCFGGIGCVMFLREFFKGIPDEMLEAARIDGCGKLKIFTSIMIPLGMPAIIAQLVLGFIGTYNDYQTPLIYLKYREQNTMQLSLQFFNGLNSDLAVASAAAVTGIVPLLILYIIFQNKIINGISFSSGLKG